MGEGSGPAGGFTVPTEFSAQWLDASYENEIIRPRATVYPMTSDSLRIPGFDTSDNSSGALFGGFVSQWLPESGEADVVDPKFRRVELRAKKLALFSKASSELVADGVGFDRQLSGAMAEASAWNMDYAFLNGTGAGQPLGILHDPSLIAVAKENAQDADTITYQNLVDMFGRLHPKCVPNSIWVFTVGAIPQLLTLNLPIGVGGAPVPVLSQAGGTFTVLTRPCFFTEKTPALGDQGDALLVDCSQYGIGLRKDLVLERSQHIYWSTDEIGFRGIVRCDGQGLWSSAFTPRNGSSLSWCVTLAARA
jgi:HK97 family phage major capsid protein